MKKLMSLFVMILMIVTANISVFANDGFDEAEYEKAVSLNGSSWTQVKFDNDIILKVNVGSKNTVSVFEIDTDNSWGGVIHCMIYTKSAYSYRTQNITYGMPAYISVPHLSDMENGYLKLDYNDATNEWMRGKTLKIRVREIATNISGWQNAEAMGLNEEHIIKFSSMNDSKWFKLVVPDESFRYTYDISSSNQGCFIGAVYREEDLKSGSGEATFCDCVPLSASKITIGAEMGSGTYYIQLYPASFYDDVLNTPFVFATDNKNSSEVVKTSFGADVSTWARDEIEKAYKNGLIPKKIEKGDLTKKVSREEFAAIAVELYEKLSNKSVAKAANCHFTDIGESNFQDEIKKAYAISAVEGISDNIYAPRTFINREQLATILCRVLKKDMEDRNITFRYAESYKPFADDSYISGWAKPSVYFMANQGLIKGVSETMFAPKNITTEQEALGYASATKEQAIIIAQRIFSN